MSRGAVPLVLPAALLCSFLVAPLLGLIPHLSAADLVTTYRDPQTKSAILTSLATASVSTILVAILGVPLAYLLARSRFPGRAVVTLLIYLPLVLPPVSAGILLIILYGPYGVIGGLLSPHGLALTDTAAGIVLAQTFVAAPFAIVAARSAFEGIAPEYIEVAATMGAGTWQIFRQIAIPMALPAIVAGLALSWMRALGEFGATVILAYHPYSLPVLNYVDLTGTGFTEALPLALLTLLIAAAVLALLFLLQRRTGFGLHV